MKKKLIILAGLVLVLICTSLISYAMMDKKHKPSDYKIGVTYEESLQNDKPAIVLFYVDWCTYCMRFMPKFKLVDSLYKDKFNVVMINAENQQYKNLVEDSALTGFPSIYLMDKKYNNRVLISNAIYSDLAKLRVELDRFLRIRALLDASAQCQAE